MHAGGHHSQPLSGRRPGVYLGGGRFPGRGRCCLCYRTRGRLLHRFIHWSTPGKLCSKVKPHPRALERDLAELVSVTGSWHKSRKGWWAQRLTCISAQGTSFHFFRLQLEEMKPVLSANLLPTTLPTEQLPETQPSYLNSVKNILLNIPTVIFPRQQLQQLPWDAAWSWIEGGAILPITALEKLWIRGWENETMRCWKAVTCHGTTWGRGKEWVKQTFKLTSNFLYLSSSPLIFILEILSITRAT